MEYDYFIIFPMQIPEKHLNFRQEGCKNHPSFPFAYNQPLSRTKSQLSPPGKKGESLFLNSLCPQRRDPALLNHFARKEGLTPEVFSYEFLSFLSSGSRSPQ